MTYHPYDGDNYSKSLNIYDALFGLRKDISNISVGEWKQIILGSLSALVYLNDRNVLHNDIKTDNILIERLPSGIRSVLIDFNKACHSNEGQLYHLSAKEKEKYAIRHPQIAPEVRCGIMRQSFASDMYSFGRVLHKINGNALKLPCLDSMSTLCMSFKSADRPSANELDTLSLLLPNLAILEKRSLACIKFSDFIHCHHNYH